MRAIEPDFLRNSIDSRPNIKLTRDRNARMDFESCFKIGVFDDFILMRRDFPMSEIPPCDFTKLLTEMFRRNEETLRDGK